MILGTSSIYTLLVWVSVYSFVCLCLIKVQTAKRIKPIFCGTLPDPKKGLSIIKITKGCLDFKFSKDFENPVKN